MPSVHVTIEELEIVFPFEPYQIQKDLMSKVVQCLRQRQNGLLESPTGTGKTLSLLCASLAWQQKQRGHFVEMMRALKGDLNAINGIPFDRVSKIIYASRTHSQLSQAINELKRCYYKKAKAVVLGSREHLCIHEEVSRMTSHATKVVCCHYHVQAHSCTYYNNLSKRKEDSTSMDNSIADIEDLMKKGRGAKLCPFFLSREMAKDADIVFMPYNYILDPKLRATHGIDLKDAVIILDEGHNVAKVCEESASFEIRNSTIAYCVNELTKALVHLNDANEQHGPNLLPKDLNISNLVSLKRSFLKLEEELDKIEVKSDGYLLPGNEIMSIFITSGFPPSLFARIVNDLERVSSFLSSYRLETSGCDKFAGILRILSSQSMLTDPRGFGDSYKVFVQLEESKKGEPSNRLKTVESKAQSKIFSFWCFSPAIGLEAVRMHCPRSIILASGTLSPMSFLMEELIVPFGVQITNRHIIGDKQLFAAVVKTGPGNVTLSSSFRNRSDVTYLKSLGELIVDVLSVVPKGVLVFFPSYSVMEMCTKEWQSKGLWDSMLRQKKVVIEPRGKDAFHAVMDEYYSSVKLGNGACLMAVCRGKVSEGLDFTDDNGRAVIITGIPYSPAKDPQVLAKQQYLDSKMRERSSGNMNGRVWYQLEATRAMNQAIGRIIRHAQDYGAILLCDERCDYADVRKNLSPWIQSRLKSFSSFNETLNDLARFFGAEVHRERRAQMVRPKEAKSSMVRTILPPIDLISDPDLEDMYGDNSVIEVVSNGRKAQAASENNVTIPSSPSTSWQKLLSGLESIVEAPSFLYSTPSKLEVPSSFENNSNKRRKLKIATTNFSFSDEAKSSIEVNRFKSIQEFWGWVKVTLNKENYVLMMKALKALRKDKNVNDFSVKIKSLFTSDQTPYCLQGLSLVLQEEDMNLLKTLIET